MSLTRLRTQHHRETQKVGRFTGEGAYHGSTRQRRPNNVGASMPIVAEMAPTTVDSYTQSGVAEIVDFTATFSNLAVVERVLPIPTQEDIRNDGVVFCWCPLEEAIVEAGPLTGSVLRAMKELLIGDKQFVYVDSKIQYFESGDVPVDSQHWHVDGTIVARGSTVEALGHTLLHDMKARLVSNKAPPRYLAYQSSNHCATIFATEPVTLTLPELIPDFVGLDKAVRMVSPPSMAQPAASIVRTDGLSLHRAQSASAAGWRLWVRCIETDREVQLDTAIIECYGSVFRTGPA
jgi:hypothetical protein